jgi:hypothetical protein
MITPEIKQLLDYADESHEAGVGIKIETHFLCCIMQTGYYGYICFNHPK